MEENFAINPDSGEAVLWTGGKWQPAPIAENAAGERMAYNGTEWVALPSAPQRAGSIGGAIQSIWDNPAPGAISRGPLDPSLIGMARGAVEGLQAPGRIMSGEFSVTPEVPGQWSEADEFRAQQARQTMQGNAGALAGTVMAGALPRVALGGGRGQLGMAGGRPGAPPPPPAPPGAGPASAAQAGELLQASQRIGLDPPRFLLDPSRTTQGVAAGLSNIPGAGDKIATATNNTIRSLGDATNRVAEGFGTGSNAVAGSYNKDALVGWITGRSKDVADRLYGSVDDVVNNSVRSPLTATKLAADGIMAERGNAFINSPSQAVNIVREAVDAPGGLNYQGIKTLRSFLGEMTPEQIVASGLRAGEVKQLYGALTTDLTGAVRNAGGQIGLARFEKANRLYEQIVERRTALSKIVGVKGDAAPEAVFARLVAMAGSKSTADIGRLAMARKTVGYEAWNELASAIVNKLGRDTRGEFSVQRFLTAYGNMPTNGRRILFKSTGRDNLGAALDDIAFVTKQIEGRLSEFANPSGTARRLTATNTVMDMIHHPIRALSTILGGNRIATLLSEPASARLTSEWLKAYRDSLVAPSAGKSRAQQTAARKLADEIIRRTGGGPGDAAQLAAQLSAVTASGIASAGTSR